ncbi:hypothetical protein [Desulfosediminicola ganghwensis]|uniref:hypothetical protein n=1 Tax=Desulfosediminicola ganghwensis TaxID=2569540 RepID=UPI0010AC298D|nr:hypothetical protein [Desulfosediminicola ganghwensis]
MTNMLDTFRKIARTIRLLQYPALLLGIGGILLLCIIIVFEGLISGENLIIPSIVCALWGFCGYFFIATFKNVPGPLITKPGFFAGIRYKLNRSWYWLVCILFVATSIAALITSVRVLLIFFRNAG